MLAAIQALTLGYNLLSGQQPGRDGAAGSDGQPGQSDSKKNGAWKEDDRQVGKIRVTNPDDDSQFVDVEVINRLVMKNQTTGETWVWTR